MEIAPPPSPGGYGDDLGLKIIFWQANVPCAERLFRSGLGLMPLWNIWIGVIMSRTFLIAKT